MVDPYGPPETHERRPAWMERAGGDPWWLAAAVGIGLFALADVIAFFDAPRHSAADIFALLGFLALEAGLTLSALLAVRLPWGARVALMLGAAVFAIRAVGLGGLGTIF